MVLDGRTSLLGGCVAQLAKAWGISVAPTVTDAKTVPFALSLVTACATPTSLATLGTRVTPNASS